jgi:F-type H+-transporting ATPase subunit delta
MKISQIKELAESVIRYDGFSEKDLKWILFNLSRQELKLFIRLLSKEIKYNNVIVSFSGELSDINKKKISAMFPNKKILFKRDDDNIVGGVRFEYGDFILDHSISGVIERILKAIRENL